MGRSSLRTAAVITLAALFTTTATASFAATSDPPAPVPIDLPSGQYIVVLAEDAAATYTGGESGLAPTQVAEGEKLDASAPAVIKYSSFLKKRQNTVASSVNAAPKYQYTLGLNGFSATLTGEQAQELNSDKNVLAVVPDERYSITSLSNDFLGLSGDSGVWKQLGGTAEAGKGVVIGVIDTGIAPENPAFAGAPLGTTPGAEPYLDGNDVVFNKADGGTFRSTRVNTGEQWDNSAYSTKLIAANYFRASAEAAAANNQFVFGTAAQGEYRSPRDGDGHGSHTTSTAGGNFGVDTVVEGVPLGKFSGVAPAAKVAAYKACWSGPLVDSTDDDGCFGGDTLAALDRAIADGVDVINFSIGGGAATSTFSIEDEAFLNAAAAGIFVAVSAGNSGPGASTADHGSPWYTTVANSTMPGIVGTLELGNGQKAAGLSAGGGLASTGIVYSGDSPATGAAAADAAQCLPNKLDPALVTGKIVVCDRGGNVLVEKAATVKAAGGVGMIILNTPTSANTVFGIAHVVPAIHIDKSFRDMILGYVRSNPTATAAIVPGNGTTWVAPPAPQIADSSSRGPVLADGSDILKPDIAAPGTDVLAATANAQGGTPTFNLLSGTSMASPHIAGLAALYLGERPNATPAEIKSALMTTAYNAVNSAGAEISDAFAQGAGQVDPRKYFEPGLLYLNGVEDWLAYLQGLGWEAGVEPIDASDLNLASIAIGSLSAPQTVTRTVTSTQKGNYTANVVLPGFDVTVSPSTLSFGAAGETATFKVTFTRTTAPVEEWATGFLTWSGTKDVRSPLAIRPVTADAALEVFGAGLTGSTDVPVTPGVDGPMPLTLGGLAAGVVLADAKNPGSGHSGTEASGNQRWVVQMGTGVSLARFDLDSSDDEGSDLDLTVYRVVSPTDLRYYEVWQSATGSADERVDVWSPTGGYYLVVADVFGTTKPITYDMSTFFVSPTGDGALTATPNPIAAQQGVATTYAFSWTGLAPEKTYLGFAQYGDSEVRTTVVVKSGLAAPAATTAPSITGNPLVGSTLKASPGVWDVAGATFAYQWLRNGEPITGATTANYRVVKADQGASLSVRVTASAENRPNGVADSASVIVKYGSSTNVSMNRLLGTSSQNYAVTVSVKPSGGPAATGTVQVRVDNKSYTGTLANGKVTIDLPKQSRGIHLVVVTYPGSDTVAGSAGLSLFLVLR